jgi:uncharacterized protein YjiS (DUF1127 family)
MNDISIPASRRQQAAAKAMTEAPRYHGLVVLRNRIAAWRARRRFRCDLELMSKQSPHLIADIGLTKRQAEAEVAKRFWQA